MENMVVALVAEVEKICKISGIDSPVIGDAIRAVYKQGVNDGESIPNAVSAEAKRRGLDSPVILNAVQSAMDKLEASPPAEVETEDSGAGETGEPTDPTPPPADQVETQSVESAGGSSGEDETGDEDKADDADADADKAEAGAA